MKKLALLIVIAGLSFAASNANANSVRIPFLSHEQKDKMNFGYLFSFLAPDQSGTTGVYGYISWNATTGSTKYISIYESDDESTLGNFLAEFKVDKGIPGNYLFLAYKYPGVHYVTILDEKGEELDKTSYYIW